MIPIHPSNAAPSEASSDVGGAVAIESFKKPASASVAAISPKPYAPAQIKPPEAPSIRDVEIGKWVHKHRHATDSLGGFLGYQIIRNTIATIPYGIATAATFLGMEKIASVAEKSASTKTGIAVPDLAAHDKLPNLTKVMRSPLRDIAMIATGFTLFRGTLKVVRYMKERLFNPNHTEEQTIQEVQHFNENLKDTFKEVSPAEIASTPAAAIALGVGRRFWNSALVPEEARVMGVFQSAAKKLQAAGGPTPLARIKNVFFTKKGNYLGEAAIMATSFVPFFELGDRRYKDAQVARGIWLNDPTSLVRKSDEQVKAELKEGKALFQTDDKGDTGVLSTQSDDPRQAILQRSSESLKATGHLRPTDAPTISCFAMRRVVPTFMGIGAYVAGKRLAYLAMGTMQEHNKSGRNWLKNLGAMALVEGAATSLFWLNSSVIDKFEPWYDKTFKDSKPSPLTDQEIRRHYVELQAKLDAKELERTGNVRSVG